MSLGKIFLQFPIKTQIYLAIVLLTIVSFCFVFLCIFIMINETITDNKNNRKKFYYDLQKKIIESDILFQNLCIHQYDQLVKSINIQIFFFASSLSSITLTTKNLNNKKYYLNYKDANYEEEKKKNELNDYIMLYYYCYENEYIFQMFISFISGPIAILAKEIRSIRIPYYGLGTILMDKYLFILYKYHGYVSINIDTMKDLAEAYDEDKYQKFIDDKIVKHKEEYKIYFEKYSKGELYFFEHMYMFPYKIFEYYNNQSFIEKNYENSKESFLEEMSLYFMFLNYGENNMYVINNANTEKTRIITEINLINNYLEFFFRLMMGNNNFNIIPLFHENNTIVSVNLCLIFLTKQISILYLHRYDKNTYKVQEIMMEVRSKIEKGKSTIDDCFLENHIDIIKNILGDDYDGSLNLDINEIILKNFDNYYDLNFTDSRMFFRASESKIWWRYFFAIKYTFPDYNSNIIFNPTLFSLTQINIYSFVNYYTIYNYWKNSLKIYYKCLYFTILLICYIWVIIEIALCCVAGKITDQIVKPIIYLQYLVDGSLYSGKIEKEENINFDIDEDIHNLFILTKNLLNNQNIDIDDQKIEDGSEKKLENNNSKANNNLIFNENLINQNQEKKKKEESELKKYIHIFRDFSNSNQKQPHKKNTANSLCKKTTITYNDENKNNLYKDLLKIVKCIENNFQNKSKEVNKTYKIKKNVNYEKASEHSAIIDEDDKKSDNNFIAQHYNKDKNNILYYWYLEAKNENKTFDIEREKTTFC